MRMNSSRLTKSTVAAVWGVSQLLVMCVALVLPGSVAHAQVTTGTVGGTVIDADKARIPGAQITLTNQDTRSQRTAKSNGEGVYNFSSVPTGTYQLEFKMAGFKAVSVKGIALHAGDQLSLSDTIMPIGASDIVVTVTAEDAVVSNGERSVLITAQDIKHLSTQGRDVTELLKILPGFAQSPGGATNATGLSNAGAGSNLVVGPGSGLGNFTANGTPGAGAGLISDGANIQDPGSAGASTQNVNMDMVEEVKIQTSNFGADSVKGPIVVNAVGKSGGSDFHGSLYAHARIYQLNSQDWLANHFNYQKPTDRFLYPGFNIGGPVLIPGTGFNRHKKLRFFAGIEDYDQRNTFSGGSAQSALRLSTVPTAGMRAGNFSRTELAKIFNVDPSLLDPTSPNSQCPNGTLAPFAQFCLQPSGLQLDGVTGINNGQLGPLAPSTAAYLKLFPLPNRTALPVPGTNQPSDGLNRQDLYLVNANAYQGRGRLDYDLSDRTKYFLTYNVERGTTYSPFTLFYNPNHNQGILADPSIIRGETNSHTASLNATHTFGPTLTNETFAAMSFYGNPSYPKNQALQTKTALGFPYGGIFQNGSQQIPNLGYGSALPLFQSPDFSFGSIFARKFSIDVGDNLTKTFGKHVTKVGFYFERQSNNQRTPFNPTQGTVAEYGQYAAIPNPNTTSGTIPATGNALANFFYGFVNNYMQQNTLPILDMNYLTIDGYVTDSWKVTPRFTLDLGVRFDHLGPWTDTHGTGLAVWQPGRYAAELPTVGGTLSGTTFPGVHWKGDGSNLPVAGVPTRAVFVEPRAGFAYDFHGNGSTTIRGGWGMYVAHDSWNDYSNALATSQGSFTESLYNTTFACVDAIGKNFATAPAYCKAGGAVSNGLSEGNIAVTAVSATDDQLPTSYTYSMTLQQRLPYSSTLEVAYAGSESAHLIVGTNGYNLQNINTVPLGSFFRPNPNPRSSLYGQLQAPSSIGSGSDYAPYTYYSTLNVVRHGLHSDYNSLQASWTKNTGHTLFNFNYTFSKALGDRGTDGGGSVGDATNKRNDTGVLAFDRSNIVNASYTVMTGSFVHGNRLVGGVLNAWEFSGITNYQSGPNIIASTSSNFSLQATQITNTPTASGTISTNSANWLGTNSVALQPKTICDPSTGLKANTFVNGACLALPALGTNGTFNYPYLHGPAFFNSDLSAQKSFHLGEKKTILFRYSAFNFLNHPLTSLVGASAQPLQLTLAPTSAAGSTVSNAGGFVANSSFGLAQYKEGRRVSEMQLRFDF